MVRLIPKAKLSSLPLNHFARAVVMATISGSEPRPRRKRAASHHLRSEDTALTIPATVQIAPKRIVDFDRAEAVDDDPAEQQDDDRGDAVDRVERADVGVGEARAPT